jgi:hypothetical protein
VFDDPLMCSDIKCIIVIILRIIGNKKCIVKNRDSVAWLIENPPHSHFTREFPTYGIADIKLVITVAPQKDI